MSGSRGRENKSNNKGRAGIIAALLFVILAVCVTVLVLKYKEKLVPERETLDISAAVESMEEETLEESIPETTVAQIITETQPTTEAAPVYKPEITLTFAGDLLLDPGYAIMASVLSRGGDLRESFDEGLLEIMEGSDVFMLNNEFPYSDRGEPLPEKAFTFRAKPEYASMLGDIGVDIVSLGNNHINDHGRDAMMDTFDILDGAGIPYVGAGRNIDEASAPYYMEVEGMKIAFLCATQIERYANPDTVEATTDTPGVFRCLSPTALEEKIKEADQNADLVVVYVHWGTEGTPDIDWGQVDQAPLYVAAGADLIIGDHPHVLQKAVMVDGVPVIYSMGNYLFTSSTVDTGLASVTVDTDSKSIKSFQFIPALQKGCRTTKLEGDEKTRIINYMNSIGSELDEEGYLIMK